MLSRFELSGGTSPYVFKIVAPVQAVSGSRNCLRSAETITRARPTATVPLRRLPVLHFPRRHVGVKQPLMQPAEFLTQVDQFMLVAFVLPAQDLSQQRTCP